jgi:hypothetical protein
MNAIRSVADARRVLRNLADWENEALGMGNSRVAPPTRAQWNNFERQRAMVVRRMWALQAKQRNEPRRPARAARLIQQKFRQARLRGRQASPPRSPRSRITATLRAKLNNLRAARNSGNRGNMVNIYNGMGRAWERAGGIHGANVMNNAQMIMHRARLI